MVQMRNEPLTGAVRILFQIYELHLIKGNFKFYF
jgi:hypothetical protein